MGSRFLVSLSILSTLLATVVAAQESLSLTPAKVKELLLTQGLGVKLLAAALESKRQDLPNVRSRYDTFFTLEGEHRIDESARTSTFFGSRTDTSKWDVGFEKLISSGTTLGVGLLNERKKVFNANTATRIPANETFEPTLELKLNQSLAENFFGRLDRAEVEKTEKAVAALDFRTRHQINGLLVEAYDLYWHWRFANDAVQNTAIALQAARDFSAKTQAKEILGVMEKTDVLGAQALVSKREALLATLQSETRGWEARLKTVLNIPVATPLAAADTPLDYPSPSEQAALQQALAHRFDLQAVKQELEEKDIQLVIAKQKKLPTLDLASTLQLNEVRASDYSAALGSMDSHDWTVGLQLRIPLENREGASLKTQAQQERVIALLNLKQLEQSILQEVAHKYQAVLLARETFQARERASTLEKNKLAAALDQYQKGRFFAERILQYHDDALEADLQALQAKRDWALALVAQQEAMNQGL